MQDVLSLQRLAATSEPVDGCVSDVSCDSHASCQSHLSGWDPF